MNPRYWPDPRNSSNGLQQGVSRCMQRKEGGAESQQNFIDKGNSIRDQKIQNEQHGGNGEQGRKAEPGQIGNQRGNYQFEHKAAIVVSPL